MQICSFTKDLKLEQVENIHVCVNLTWTLRFFPQGQTVNVELYCIIFRHLRENIQLKQPEL